MSPELIGILGVGIGLLTAIIAVAGLNLVQINNSERRTSMHIEQLRAEMNRRFDQMQEEMDRRSEETNRRFEETNRRLEETNRRLDQMQEEMNRRFDSQDERIRGLEMGQAHLAGQFDILKDHFMHQPGQG